MKKIIFSAAILAATIPAFAGTITVYGSKSTTTTTTTTTTGGTTTTTTIGCSGDMSKVCYTRDTKSLNTPQIGEAIQLSVYKDGAISEVCQGILRNYSLDSEAHTYVISER